MNSMYIFIYHAIYWIYRVVSIWSFTYVLYGENWYKGAYIVQLVLMPFFYINYFFLIPLLINKHYKQFVSWSILWLASFVWAYSNWTIYQRKILYDEGLLFPDYIETCNNLIYIWLISTCFCLFEFWVKNIRKNQALAQDSKRHMLITKENSMLNHLLSDYLDTLDKKECEVMSDKIMLLSDFFKYILYSQRKIIALETETDYLKIFEELKNESKKCLNIHYNYNTTGVFVRSSQLVFLVNRLVTQLFVYTPVEVSITLEQNSKLLIALPILHDTPQNREFWNELSDFNVKIEVSKSAIILFVQLEQSIG